MKDFKTGELSVVAIAAAKTHQQLDLGDGLVPDLERLLAVYHDGGDAAIMKHIHGHPLLSNVRPWHVIRCSPSL